MGRGCGTVLLGVAACALLVPLSVPAAAPPPTTGLVFTPFVQTEGPVGDVLWTGREFLYAYLSWGTIKASYAAGAALRPWAQLKLGGEEMRCAVPPNHYWRDGVYCHTPDDRIIRFARDGTSATVIARLPSASASDGTVAFDTSGEFGHALLAATGGSNSNGGDVYTIRTNGRVQKVGHYPGPGGADGLAVAPAKFGSASGWLLIAIDYEKHEGRLLAINRKGKLKRIAHGLGNGINPIAVITTPKRSGTAVRPKRGVYVADVLSGQVFYSPIPAGIATGSVIVGAELTGQFWTIVPTPSGGFRTSSLPATYPSSAVNLEGSTYVP
jgi:hypothetical protein